MALFPPSWDGEKSAFIPLGVCSCLVCNNKNTAVPVAVQPQLNGTWPLGALASKLPETLFSLGAVGVSNCATICKVIMQHTE